MATDPRTKCRRECLGKWQKGSHSCLSFRLLACACNHDPQHNAAELRSLQTTSRASQLLGRIWFLYETTNCTQDDLSSITLFRSVQDNCTDNLVPSTQRMGLRQTRRQQELVPMIARGLTNKEIASHLNLSEQTIKNHIHRILRRVGANDRFEVAERIQHLN